MKGLKRTPMIVIAALLLASLSAPCRAADSPNRNPDDLIETPAKGTLLLFTNNHSNQLDYFSTPPATDLHRTGDPAVSAPAASLIAIANGNITISMPAITPEFVGSNAKGFAGVLVKAELLSVKF